jgi:mannan endo-1,6-alpha-mannosidase
LNSTSVFFNNSIMFEVACEGNGKCDTDQRSFKAYLSRWLGATLQVAPFTNSTIYALLSTSAQAAAKTCTAGDDGNQCGLRWTLEANDGSLGVGEQMAAMEVFNSLLTAGVAGPVTNTTGGTSVGDYSAGTSTTDDTAQLDEISTKDKAGAGILTVMVLGCLFGGAWWILS